MKNINYKHTILLVVAVFFISINAIGQVAIGTTDPVTPDASSMLDVQSTTKGILVPRMTTAQRTAISSPATGLLVFDLTTETFWFYTTAWEELVAGSSASNELVDADGDTKVEVEKVTDTDPNGDEINFTTRNVERMKIGNDGVTKIGDIAGGNDTKIEADGTLEFEGNARVWDDLRVTLDKGKDGAKLSWMPGESSGGEIWYFQKDRLDNMSFAVQLPHSYKEGTKIYPHVHWTPEDTKAGDVEWKLYYTWANYQDNFDSATLTSAIATGPFTSGDHLITDLTGGSGIDPSTEGGGDISSILICRIQRDAKNAVNNTYDGDVGLLFLDFHFEMNTIGSRQQYIK